MDRPLTTLVSAAFTGILYQIGYEYVCNLFPTKRAKYAISLLLSALLVYLVYYHKMGSFSSIA